MKLAEQVSEDGGAIVIERLDKLWREFDNLCTTYGVQKIETVGYTYMAALNLKMCEDNMNPDVLEKNQYLRALDFAFSMKRVVSKVKWGKKLNKQLEFKLGINLGDVITGIIGDHKPQFSLIGDPVNTTSRIASTGKPNGVTVSDSFYLQTRKDDICYFCYYYFTSKWIKPKGKDDMKVWEVTNVKTLSSGLQKILAAYQNGLLKQQENRIQAQYQLPATLDFSKYTLLVKQQKTEEKTQEQKLLRYKLIQLLTKKQKLQMQLLLLATAILILCQTFLQISNQRFFEKELFVFLSRGLVALFFLLSSVFMEWIFKKAIGNTIFLVVIIFSIIVINLNDYYSEIDEINTVQMLEYLLLHTVICSLTMLFYFQVVVITLIMFLVFFIVNGVNSVLTTNNIYFFLFGIIINLLKCYHQKKTEMESFNRSKLIRFHTEEENKLVSKLLPKHAYERYFETRLEANQEQLVDQFPNCSILYADIAGFTSYSSSQKDNVEKVVEMLKQLFSNFDKSCFRNQCYKVCTIGDCYVAIGFDDSRKRNPLQEAKNLIQLGLDMVDIIEKVKKEISYEGLNMRIGIHTGLLIGGIIGTEVVRYDIYGAANMIANNMESEGKIGHVMVSKDTKELLESEKGECAYQFVEREGGPAKSGIGDSLMPAYYISKRKQLHFHQNSYSDAPVPIVAKNPSSFE